MAIRHRRTTIPNYAWQASDLAEGQIGLNIADGTLHFKKSDNSIVQLDDFGADLLIQETAPTDTTAIWVDTSGTGGEISVPDNVVIVKSAADLPAAVSGVRQLADNTLYQFNGTVTLTDTLALGTNSMLGAQHLGNDVLVYTGTGTAITGTNKNFFVEKLTIVAPNGTALNLSGTTSTEMILDLVSFVGCATIGTISGFRVPTFLNCNFDQIANGLTFTGTSEKVFFDGCPFRGGSSGTTSLTFDADFETEILDIQSCYWKTANSAHTAINWNAGAVLNDYALLQGNSFVGMTTPLVGIGPATANFSFVNNTPTRDSRRIGSVSLVDNTTATTLTQNTWTKIAGTTSSGALERFTSPESNRLTYSDKRGNAQGIVVATLSVLGSVNNQIVEVALYKNGTIASPVMRALLTGTVRAEAMALNAIIDFNENDYVEVWCRCTSGSNNLTVEHMQLTVNA